MVESAGRASSSPMTPRRWARAPPTEKALGLMVDLANSEAADPSQSTSTEDTARLSFEAGSSSLHAQLPVRLSERQGERARRLQEPRRGPLPTGRPEPAVGAATRGHQPRRLELLRAQAGGLRRDRVHDPAAEPDRDRDGRRAAAGHREALRREGDRQGLPGLRRSDPPVDRAGGAPARHPGLSGSLAGDPADDSPARRHRSGQVPDKVDELRQNVQDALDVKGLL